MNYRYASLFFSLLFAAPCIAKPYIQTIFNVTSEHITRAQVINKTNQQLTCYIAINGKKIAFLLGPMQRSVWYKATDPRYQYKDFSTWCDYSDRYLK